MTLLPSKTSVTEMKRLAASDDWPPEDWVGAPAGPEEEVGTAAELSGLEAAEAAIGGNEPAAAAERLQAAIRRRPDRIPIRPAPCICGVRSSWNGAASRLSNGDGLSSADAASSAESPADGGRGEAYP